MSGLFTLADVAFAYGRRPVLAGLNLSLEAGQVTALLGPNGSGKSTLLRLMLGILRPSRGRVLFRGRDLAEYPPKALARQVAYLPQNHRAVFAYTVLDVVLLGRLPHLGFCASFGRRDRDLARESLEQLGIARLARVPYTEISGGEQQLTLLARALTQGAEVFVMDEPESALDYGNQVRLLMRVSDLAAKGRTFLFSTHSPDHALRVAHRAVLLRDGVVLGDGIPAEVIDQISLEKLYDVEARLAAFEDGSLVCLPRLQSRL
jgi:iron complex transport system ATP-binding protein